VDDIVSEWNLVHKIQIEATTTDEFWSRVSQMTTASGKKRFGHISKLATSLLSLPFSNRSVERSFSIMNIVKNKLRNQMSVKTAEAILRVKDNFPNSALFTPMKEMLKKFCSSEMYNSEVDESVINTLSEF
ncbi:GSCOCG00011452001-RA-CDS, partial [Cotesia congregata]